MLALVNAARTRFRLAVLLLAGLAAISAAKAQDGETLEADAKDWRKTLGTFRVGILSGAVSDRDPADISAAEERLSSALGMPVRIVFFSSYPSMIDAHATSRIAYGVYTASAFATLDILCTCVRAVVAPVADGGFDAERGVLLVSGGKGFDLGNLSSGRIALAREAASVGALLAPEE